MPSVLNALGRGIFYGLIALVVSLTLGLAIGFYFK